MSTNGLPLPTDNLSLPNGSTPSVTVLPHNYPTILQKYMSCRWRLCYMLCMAFLLSMILRNCMPFAILCMTGEAYHTNNDIVQKSSLLNQSTNHSNLELEYRGEFNYTSEEQGLLISSPFYGAMISPLIGFLSRTYGPKKIILLFMLTSCVVTFLTPLSARTSFYLLLGCRVVAGFAAVAVMTGSFDLWLFWAPVQEKEQLVSYTFVGLSLALILQYMVSGFICLMPVDNGWPFIFYMFGSLSLLWSVVWYLTIYESPENHQNITDEERVYVIANRSKRVKKAEKVPWKNIALSKPVWASGIVCFCHDWNGSILFGYLPLYMATVLKFDVTRNGLLSSLPYISQIIGTFCWSHLAVRLTRFISVTATRKLVQCTGFVVAGGLLVALCYCQEGQEYVAIGIFIMVTPFTVVTINSAVITPVDMAPQYASVIISIGITAAFGASMISPLCVSYIIPERTRQQWSIVFYSMAGIYTFAATVFLLFGSGKLQPWANKPCEAKREINVKKGEENAAYVSEMDEITHM